MRKIQTKKQAPPPPIRQNSAPVPIERSRADEKLLRALEELVQTEKRYVEDLIEVGTFNFCISSVFRAYASTYGFSVQVFHTTASVS